MVKRAEVLRSKGLSGKKPLDWKPSYKDPHGWHYHDDPGDFYFNVGRVTYYVKKKPRGRKCRLVLRAVPVMGGDLGEFRSMRMVNRAVRRHASLFGAVSTW